MPGDGHYRRFEGEQIGDGHPAHRARIGVDYRQRQQRCGRRICIIQVKKRNKIEEGWQRNFLAAILACNQGMRLAIAVDNDVDIYSMDDVMWTLTTRVNPHTDILNPIPGGIGQTFQPQERLTAGDKEWTASNTRFEGGMGIDATLPFGYEKDFQRPVYPIERIDLGKWFASKDIERAKAQMRGWVESLARTGR